MLSCQMRSGFLTRAASLPKWMPLCSDAKIFLRYCLLLQVIFSIITIDALFNYVFQNTAKILDKYDLT